MTTSTTLPGWVYNSSAFLELEKEHLFRTNWLCIGHVCEIPEPGDYLTLDVADERVFVIRDQANELHALHNVCRHRASRLVSGNSGHCEGVLVCPYHGWSYDLDGALRGVPAEESFESLDKRAIRLPAVELEQWMGLLFVRIGSTGPAVRTVMQPFDDELRPYGLTDLRPLGACRSTVVHANWKCIVDNDAEGYHVPRGHPGLQRLFGDSYRDVPYPMGASRSVGVISSEPSTTWSERLYQTLLPEVEHLPDTHQRTWLYFGIFPSFSIGIYPDLVEYMQILPLDPHRSLVQSRAYALPDPRAEMKAARYLNDRINDQVWREDLALVEAMEPGLRSSSYHGGPLSSKEVCLAQYHDLIRTAIPVACLPREPEGTVTETNRRMRAARMEAERTPTVVA